MSRIALFSPNLAGGGAERIISILANCLSEAGFSVDLILVKAKGPYLKQIPASVNIIDFNRTKASLSFFKLVSYLIRQRPNILFTSHIHTSTIALWASRASGRSTKVIVRQPTMLRPLFGSKTFASLARQKIFLWSVKKWANKIVVTSQAMADEFFLLSNVEKYKVSIINNPLPIHSVIESSNEPLNNRWLNSKETPVVLAVGRLEPVKSHETLIEAMALVRNEVDAKLIILGDGPLRTKLQDLVEQLNLQNHVEMPGFTKNPFKYMKRCDVFVMSSLWEGFPNVILEAMACGAKVVATDCEGGTAEILENGKWGELVEVNNSIEMAGKICEVLKTKERHCANERVGDFAVDNIINQYRELFINHLNQ